MKNKFNLIVFIAALALTVPVSCSDYLDFPAEGVVPSEEFFQNANHAEQAVVSIYAHMRAWTMVGFAYVIMQEITSDNAVKGSAVGDASFINDFDRFNFTSNQFILSDYWSGRYQGINRANQAISNIPGISMDEARKARLIGEAKFARAMFYFDLVRAFGDIPMPTTVENTQEESTEKAPASEVYALIIQDLQDAITVLPEQYAASERGRATVWAARGLLAKVYLYQEDWANVLTHTAAIIGSGRFSLLENFYDVFRIENENGAESIFEIQAAAVPGIQELGSQHSQIQGVRGENGFGWGFNLPSDDLIAAFDAAGDTERKEATVLMRGDVTPDGDLIEGVPPGQLEGVGQPRYNGKSYVPRSQQVSGIYEGAGQNIRVLRYAEILLIDAEAKLQSGDAGGAATSLNLVRERAWLDPIAAPTLQDIWNERRLELAMEGDRFFDLVRTGQAATVLGPLGFEPGTHEVFPIPQNMIDITNNAIEQNPNY
jgi:starch-binding outer membrane protein, SusD/RagB family